MSSPSRSTRNPPMPSGPSSARFERLRLLLITQAGGEPLPLRGDGDAAVQAVAIEFFERGALLGPRRVGAGTDDRARAAAVRQPAANSSAAMAPRRRRAPRTD